MTSACPRCRSVSKYRRCVGKKTLGSLGTVTGLTRGAAQAWQGARVGTVIGFRAGPEGALLGAITGAILGGLLGGATGCSIGSALGAVLDEHVLDTYRCCNCRYTFSAPQT